LTTSQKRRIFISYRRTDSAGYAGRIYDRLTAHFGVDAVFMDVDTIEAGLDVLIALIGRRWLDSKDADGKWRLENPEDFVRVEIAAALERDIRVIPVLVDGSSMPRSTELPDNLRSLARRNALQVDHHSFNADAQRLISQLELALKAAEDSRILKARRLQEEQERRVKETREKAKNEGRERKEREAREKQAIQDNHSFAQTWNEFWGRQSVMEPIPFTDTSILTQPISINVGFIGYFLRLPPNTAAILRTATDQAFVFTEGGHKDLQEGAYTLQYVDMSERFFTFSRVSALTLDSSEISLTVSIFYKITDPTFILNNSIPLTALFAICEGAIKYLLARQSDGTRP
jgi:hypothetical protein